MAPLTQLAFLAPLVSYLSTPALDPWIDQQNTRSLQGVLSNIGPHPNSHGAAPGVVIASPSTGGGVDEPDYLFTWTRDAALVTKGLLDQLIQSGDESIETVLQNYVDTQAVLQHLSTPSGDYTTGGLAEPKFHINKTAFTGPWGRPQRDGPALRATTLMGYSNYLTNGEAENSNRDASELVPLIRADLDYVVTHWNQSGFDLWEEVLGSSFFTAAVQHRALLEGAAFFAEASPASAGRYRATAENVLCFLQSFWSPESGFIISNINIENGNRRSGLDGNSILASIHTYDPSATTCDSATFQPCSDRALSNHRMVVDSFRSLYAINGPHAVPGSAIAVGRYPEDVYYQGQPWYILTAAASEQLYDALYTWDKAGELNITETSLPFFRDIVPSAAKVGTLSKGSKEFEEVTKSVRRYADGFLDVVRKFTPADGSLAEQFNRETGIPLSARNLTWSYGSFLTAVSARHGRMPPAWPSSDASISCAPSESNGPFVAVTFRPQATTYYGETILIVGSIPQLGNWDPSQAVPLEWHHATKGWQITLQLPSRTRIEYKFIRRTTYNGVQWEMDPNRRIMTNNGGQQVIETSWR